MTAKSTSSSKRTALTRYNAVTHGVLSRNTILPWEDARAYDRLIAALANEHSPQGPTELHLVQELASIFWRKRRLELAEVAVYKRGLKETMATYSETAKRAMADRPGSGPKAIVESAITTTTDEIEAELRDIAEDEAMTEKAIAYLRAGRSGSYDEALGAVRQDTREWWMEITNDKENDSEDRPMPNATCLLDFLMNTVMPWYNERRQELASHPVIRNQAFGEAFDPERLDKLARYEVHLDRKLERTLAMLLRLKEIKAASVETNSVSQN